MSCNLPPTWWRSFISTLHVSVRYRKVASGVRNSVMRLSKSLRATDSFEMKIELLEGDLRACTIWGRIRDGSSGGRRCKEEHGECGGGGLGGRR